MLPDRHCSLAPSVQPGPPVPGHPARRAGHRLVGGMMPGRRQLRAAGVHAVLRVAPEPRLAWLEAADQRVPGGRRVRAGVLGRRGVAAADVPARRTAPQVEPPAPGFFAVGAARPAGRDRRVDRRFRGHPHTPLSAFWLPDAARRFWYNQRNPYPRTAGPAQAVTPERPRYQAATIVPALPCSSASASPSRPMAATFPVASTNRQTASILGPMDPAGKDRDRSSVGVTRRSGR